MSLLNKASLIQIPSGYKDGTLYSAKPTNGDGDFTFSRGSNLAATRVNSEGLIEKGRENLVKYSNAFDNGYWSKSDSSIVTGQADPNGGSNAFKVVENTNTAYHRIFGNYTMVNGNIYTTSVTAKAAGRNYLTLSNNVSAGTCIFNLTDGSISLQESNVISASTTSLGGGWYRCEMVAVGDKSGTYNVFIGCDDDGVIAPYTGNGTSGVLIYQSQLEQGLVATDYIPTTTTTAQAGILEDMPRLDYSGGASCPSLLLEPSRTQLLPQSEYANSSDWNNGGTTYENNAGTSPEGVDNAIKVSEDTSTAFHYLGSQKTGVSTAGDYTISAFIKKGSRRYAGLRGVTNGFVNRYFVLVDLNDGSVVDTNTFGSGVTWSHNVTAYANGWYRIEITGGHTSGTIDGTFGLSDSDSPSYTGGLPTYNGVSGEHIFCYGLQIEAGSYPTSYIPTYGSSVTRGNDGFALSSLPSFSNNTEFSIYLELTRTAVDTGQIGQHYYFYSVSPTAFNFWLHVDAPSAQIRFRDALSSNTTMSTISFSANETKKIVIKSDGTNFKTFANGTLINTYAMPTAFQLEYFTYAVKTFNLNQFLAFPTDLTDAECIALTTI